MDDNKIEVILDEAGNCVCPRCGQYVTKVKESIIPGCPHCCALFEIKVKKAAHKK